MRTYKKPSTVLNKAADLLLAEGWTRGAMECINGKRCAVGAVAAITGDLVDDPYYEPDDEFLFYSDDEPLQVKNTKRRPSALFNEALYYLGESLLPENHYLRNVWKRRQSAYEREGVIVDLNDETATRAKIVKAMRAAADVAKAEKR